MSVDEATAVQQAQAPVAEQEQRAPVLVPVGVVPGAGASTVAAACATAAAQAGRRVRLVDAAAPHRSALRGLVTASTDARVVAQGVTITTGRAAPGMRVEYLDAPGPRRWDEVDEWPVPGGCDTVVVDVGLSAEELLENPAAQAWLGAEVSPDPWVVLVSEPTPRCLRRAEAVLARWGTLGAPIAQIVLVGPHSVSTQARASLAGFTADAVSMAIELPWVPALYSSGLEAGVPTAMTTSVEPLLHGAKVLAPPPSSAAPRGRRFRRRNP